MYVIIVGFGRVGSRTARVLQEEGHEIVVVERDHTKAERARDRGLRTVEGDGASTAVLEEAGIADADAIGGLTGDVEVNHAVCMLGAEYGCRTVMRISEDSAADVYDEYSGDVDEVIYPERLGSAGAKTALLGGNFNAIADLTEQLQLTTIRVPEGAPIVGAHVNEVDVDERVRIYAHSREDEPLTIPLPGTIIEPGDRLAVLVKRDQLDAITREFIGE